MTANKRKKHTDGDNDRTFSENLLTILFGQRCIKSKFQIEEVFIKPVKKKKERADAHEQDAKRYK